MRHECLHKRPGGQVGLVLETHCKKRLSGFLGEIAAFASEAVAGRPGGLSV